MTEREYNLDGQYHVECSWCPYHCTTRNGQDAAQASDEHEHSTGHKGPFVWFLSEKLRLEIQRSRDADRQQQRIRAGLGGYDDP